MTDAVAPTAKTDPPDHDENAQPFAAGNSNELAGLNFGRRRRWPFLLLGIALGVAGTFGAAAFADRNNTDETETDTVEVALATAEVRVQDLIEEVEWVADLGYGDPIDVVAATDATVTGTTEAGTLLARGDVVFELDNEPVVAFYGQLPFWRQIANGDEGPDVNQLETNLVALGYDPDTTVTIDDTFTSNTALMVSRWQEEIGHEITGVFDPGAVVVIPGPVSVTTPATVGESLRSGGQVASLSARAETTTVLGELTGTVTTMIDTEAAIEQGSVLYATADRTVQAVVQLDEVSERLLDPETDPAELESVLDFLGYDPDRAMVIDSVYDDATMAAIERWQVDVGLTPTGELDSSAYVALPEGLRVAEQLLQPDDVITAPRPMLVLDAPTLEIVIPVGLADQDAFVVGQELLVELPDETTVPGVVVDVGTIATGADLNIAVAVELTEAIDENLPASEVLVIVAGDSVADALVVPTRALVTLVEGGFAVEKVLDDGSTILLGVETGTFDDGVVEVLSGQIEAGDNLVVPQ